MLYNKITIGYTEFMKQQGENLMTKYYFEIISTIDTSDHSDKIKIGDALYGLDEDSEFFATEKEAIDEGYKILVGLDGNRAYNLALESAEVVAREKI